jgi:hypothetical protein
MIAICTKGIGVKKRLLLISAVMVLSACDAQKSPEAFTPEMASFSNEFEFDPLRGPVKDFSQTLFDEHDEVVKRVSASLSREGCFDLLALEDRENNTGATLMLDANFYLDARTREKRLRLQENASSRNCRRQALSGRRMITALWWPRVAKRRLPPISMTARVIRPVKPPWRKMSVLR